MKLELKHLAPYLPYDLQSYVEYNGHKLIKKITVNNVMCIVDNEVLSKPILRPMQDIFKDEYKFILDEFSEIELETFETAFFCELRPLNIFDKISYSVAILLYENHFDIHGLIEKGLAVDVNSI